MILNSFKRTFYNNSLLYLLKNFLTFSGVVVVPYLFNNGIINIPLLLGALAAGLIDLDDHIRGRLKNIGVILATFFISSLIVEWLFPYPFIFGISLVIGTGLLIMLGALGPRYATIAFGALIITVYAMLSYLPEREWYLQPSYLVLGALWYNIISLIFNLIWPVRPLQENMANCYSQLAQFLEIKSQFFDPDEIEEFEKQRLNLTNISHQLMTSLDLIRLAIMRRVRNDRGKKSMREILMYYISAQEIYERAASAHVEYEDLRETFTHSDVLFRFQRLLMQQSIGCQKISEELLGKGKYRYVGYGERLINRLEKTLSLLRITHQKELSTLSSMKSLLKNLIAIDQIFQKLGKEKEAAVDPSYINAFIISDTVQTQGLMSMRQKIKQNLTRSSEVFRHAVRMSFVMGISCMLIALTNHLFSYFTGEAVNLTRAYWILLTALFVCQPNYGATKLRVVMRLWGTLFGVLAAILIVQADISEVAQICLIILAGMFFLSFRRARYSWATALITTMILLCFNLNETGFVAPERMLDTIIGCGIAWFAVMFILPDWQYRDLNQKIAGIFMANQNYLKAIYAQYHEGRNDSLEYLLVRDTANSADGELAMLFSNITTEPKTGQQKLDEVFKLLCVNNTFLGYLSALGSHRTKITNVSTLTIFDHTVTFISDSLANQSFDKLQYDALKEAIRAEKDIHTVEEFGIDETLLQQLLLLLKSLPIFITTMRGYL